MLLLLLLVEAWDYPWFVCRALSPLAGRQLRWCRWRRLILEVGGFPAQATDTLCRWLQAAC